LKDQRLQFTQKIRIKMWTTFKKISISRDIVQLKVHKIENFFGSEFEFCTFSLLVLLKYKDFVKNFFDWPMNGGDKIVSLV
jgi:hypothetical protein